VFFVCGHVIPAVLLIYHCQYFSTYVKTSFFFSAGLAQATPLLIVYLYSDILLSCILAVLDLSYVMGRELHV